MKLKLPIFKNASLTLQAWWPALTRSNFITLDDVILKDWNPLPLSASGTMTITAQAVNKARYAQLGNLVLFSTSITGITTATAPATTIYFNAPVIGLASAILYASFSGFGSDGGAVIGMYGFLATEKLIGVSRYDGGNWGNGVNRALVISGFYEANN